MNRTLRFNSLIICLLSFTLLSSQNTEWLTDLEEGLKLAKEENKNVLLELGIVQNGTPLFIYDDIWSDEVILDKLSSFIPVSIDLKNEADLVEKYQLIFAPTILLLNPNGDVIFKTSGMKTLFELDDLLLIFQNELDKIQRLSNLYENEDIFGNFLRLDEYMKLVISSPSHLEDDLMKFAKERLSLIGLKQSELNPLQKQRLQIYTHLYDLIEYSEEAQLRKLYKLGKKGLITSNHSLLLFAIGVGEYFEGKSDKAKAILTELEKRLPTDPQAAEYASILSKGLEYD